MRIVTVAAALALALSAVACNHTACKRMCECNNDGYASEDQCVNECEDMMDELSDDCQKEMRSTARCMRYNDCDEEECEEEIEDMMQECFIDLEAYTAEEPAYPSVEPE